ncbi:MAG TPA: hypothetical protein PLZ36_07735 [Armatimonadota bacterium]|mgnify:CR=1 FL=1|nr:hypothetical protein [Armatimonadota bacterium]HOS42383.1 hypothetical protein [Armatimonadota bacterium]
MADEEKTPQPEETTPEMPDDVTQEVVEETAPDAAEAAVPETAEEPAAAVAEAAPEAPVTAEAYVAKELAAARAALLRTQVIGLLVVIGFSIYLIAITRIFTLNLQPDNAVQTISGLVTGQIEEHQDAFIQDVSTRVPEMIQEIPDRVITQMPVVRGELESRFEETLTKYCEATANNLSGNLAQYIADNKEAIAAVLTASKDPDAVAKLGPSIREEVMAFLKAAPADGGPSIDAQVKESLKMLTDAESKLHHLITAKTLTATEQKTRRAIAIIANAIEAEALQPIEMPQLTLEDADVAE